MSIKEPQKSGEQRGKIHSLVRCKHSWFSASSDAELRVYWCKKCGKLKTEHGRFRDSQNVYYYTPNEKDQRQERRITNEL